MLRLEKIASQIKEGKEFIYSVPVTQKIKGQTPIYRKVSHKNGLLKVPPQINSFADLWDITVKKYPKNKLIEESTYTEVDKNMRKVGSWLLDNNHQMIFLYCKNSPNWTLVDLACWNYGQINVPLYDTLGSQAFEHILKLTNGTLLIATADLIPNIIKNLGKDKANIKEILFLDNLKEKEHKQLQTLGIKITLFSTLLSYNKIRERPKLNLQTQISFAFTSGTTGIPKGVVYTHRIGITQLFAMENHFELLQTDVHMSFLPIAHTFERFVMWMAISSGTNVRYAKFPTPQIIKDLATIKPTFIPIVPRLLNKFYPVMKGLYEKQGNYNKVKAAFGGRMRMMVTGSAPVSPQILTFFKTALQCDLRQGYGQTQTMAAIFVTYEGDINYGHVGGPNSAIQYKLVDVPEMNYTSESNPPKGQVCVRGDSIFKSYYKDPKNTKQTVDSEGWNHSGDIGVILPNGALKIVDRKKNIYKLSQGQYIAPEKIQNVYVRCKFIAEAFVYGDSIRDYNVAVIHPNLDYLPMVAQKLGVQEKDVKKLCENKKITNFILEEITAQGKKDGLVGFQQAKKIRLWPESFQVLGIFTSTMKLQRYQAKKVFEGQINKLYAE